MNWSIMKTAASLFLIIISATHVYPQQDTLKASVRPAGMVALTDVVAFVPSVLLVINFHELGHATFMKLAGAHNVRWGIYRRTRAGRTQIGWAQADIDGVSPTGRAFISIGGVLFSRGITAEVSDCMVNTVDRPFWVQQFFSMTFLMAHFDFPRYVLQDALLNLFNSKGSDIDDFVTAVAGHTTGTRTLTYAALIGVAAVDLVHDWPRITRHWAILRGKTNAEHTARSQMDLSVSPYVADKTFGVSASVKW